MATVVVRFITGVDGPVSALDSATALAEEDLSSSGTSAATTIAASGAPGEVCVIYPLGNVRVAFGSAPTATTSAGPVAYSGVPNVFRNLANGDKVAVIDAT